MPERQLAKPKRGDIVLVPFPNSDLTTTKMRPALIVQFDNIDTELHQVVIAMISSNLGRIGRSSRVSVPSNSETGLLFESVVMADNLATILTRQIVRIIGKLEQMGPVDMALRYTLDLD